MHKNNSQTFGVVGLENLDHELYRAIVLSAESIENLDYGSSRCTMFAKEKSVISKTIA